jgi:hypothetical protein
MDNCPGKSCGLPVHWNGSKVADTRYATADHQRRDAEIKARRNKPALSPTTAWVLAWARRGAGFADEVKFIRGEEEQLLAWERKYPGTIEAEVARIDAMPEEKNAPGRGRILHLLRSKAFIGGGEEPPVVLAVVTLSDPDPEE